MNKVILLGRITKDLELKNINNKALCSFSIAVNKKYKKDGEPTADFINIVTFGKTAEFVSKWFSKGSPILISGRIQTRNWQDKDGNKRISVDVVAEEVEFAGGEKKNTADVNINDFSEVSDDDGNVPF